jgi:hypothetical protein
MHVNLTQEEARACFLLIYLGPISFRAASQAASSKPGKFRERFGS